MKSISPTFGRNATDAMEADIASGEGIFGLNAAKKKTASVAKR